MLHLEGTLAAAFGEDLKAVAFGKDLESNAADLEVVLLSVVRSQEGGKRHPCFEMKMVSVRIAGDLVTTHLVWQNGPQTVAGLAKECDRRIPCYHPSLNGSNLCGGVHFGGLLLQVVYHCALSLVHLWHNWSSFEDVLLPFHIDSKTENLKPFCPFAHIEAHF